jgi:hypothetical protein
MMVLGIFNLNVLAATPVTGDGETEIIVVDFSEVVVPNSANRFQRDLRSHSAHTPGVGIINSITETVDFSNIVPNGRRIVSITLYCPTFVRVTQSPFTAIQSFVVSHPDRQGVVTIPFVRTDRPSFNSTSTAFAGLDANVRFQVQVQGRVLSNATGLDGFTVMGGARFVLEVR